MPNVTLERIHDPIPQGTYRVSGRVDPPGTILAAEVSAPDGSLTDEGVTVDPDGATFTVEAYLQQLGYGAFVSIIALPGDPAEQSFKSDTFAVCRAIDIDAIHDATVPQTDAQASLILRGYYRGESWETAEWCEVRDGTEGVWSWVQSLTHDQDGAAWFAEPIRLDPGEGLIIRVRKAENPGITTDSNPFNVLAYPMSATTGAEPTLSEWAA